MSNPTVVEAVQPPRNQLPRNSEKPSRTPWLLFLIALAVAGVVGWLWWQAQTQAMTANTTLEDTQKRLARTEGDKTSLEEAKASLEQKLTEREQAMGELSAKSEELQQSLESKEAELAKLKATSDSLEDKLKAEIAKGEIRISQTGDRIQVDLVDRILFDSGDAALAARGQEVLGRVAAVLATIDDKQIQVSGHTDDIPIKSDELKKQFPTNWELSVARAVIVVRYLSETGGVKPERLTAAGHGQFHPIASNSSPAGRAKNRRIEILLTPALDTKKAALALPKPGPASSPAPVPQPAATSARAKPTPRK